jgi:hypothetical protein
MELRSKLETELIRLGHEISEDNKCAKCGYTFFLSFNLSQQNTLMYLCMNKYNYWTMQYADNKTCDEMIIMNIIT